MAATLVLLQFLITFKAIRVDLKRANVIFGEKFVHLDRSSLLFKILLTMKCE